MDKFYNIKMFDLDSNKILLDGNNIMNIWILEKNHFKDIKTIKHNKYVYSEEEIKVLINKGIKLNFSPYFEEKNIFNENWVKIYLSMTYDCNLACDYCFAKDFHSADKTNRNINIDLVEQVFKLLIDNYPNLDKISIDFYGGEPLLCYEAIKKTIKLSNTFAKSHNLKFNFSVNTNGLLLDKEKIRYFIDHDVTVIISCDGPKAEHNYSRMKDGSDEEHKKLLEKIKMYTEALKNEFKDDKRLLVINSTLKKEGPFISEIANFFMAKGIKHFMYGPIIGTIENEHAFRGNDFVKMESKYEELYVQAVEDIKKGLFYKKLNSHYFRFKDRLLMMISGNYSSFKLYPGCRAGKQHFTISPDGSIFLCPVLQYKKFELGKVQTGFNYSKIKQFNEFNVVQDDNCKYCWNKYFCGGSCFAMNYFNQGNINKHDIGYCELDKFITEKAINLFYKIVKSEDRSFHDYIIANYLQ